MSWAYLFDALCEDDLQQLSYQGAQNTKDIQTLEQGLEFQSSKLEDDGRSCQFQWVDPSWPAVGLPRVQCVPSVDE